MGLCAVLSEYSKKKKKKKNINQFLYLGCLLLPTAAVLPCCRGGVT